MTDAVTFVPPIPLSSSSTHRPGNLSRTSSSSPCPIHHYPQRHHHRHQPYQQHIRTTRRRCRHLMSTTSSISNSNSNSNDELHSSTITTNKNNSANKLPMTFQRLCDAIRNHADEKSRLLGLAALGDEIHQLEESQLEPATRVKGCTSVTHLQVSWNESDAIEMRGYSDAKFARGLLALMIIGLNGENKSVILQIKPNDILDACGLSASFVASQSHQRVIGLSSILQHIHHYDTLSTSSVRINNKTCATPTKFDFDLNTLPKVNDNSDYQLNIPDDDSEIACLVSGGVDSSVALYLTHLLYPHRKITAYYLKIWLDDEVKNIGFECPWEEELDIVRQICKPLNISLHDVSLQKEYYEQVVQYTIDEARKGRTPNPDIMCNSRIKFGTFYNKFLHDDQHVITGHYAQKEYNHINQEYELHLSNDPIKDQTYFLSHLNQQQLARANFPLGCYNKSQVRQIAKMFNLVNHNKSDSQGICFLGKFKFEHFLTSYLGINQGPLVDFDTGHTLGTHNGYWFFTIGQRKGIGLPDGPWYVVSKHIDSNTVYVSKHFHSLAHAHAHSRQRKTFTFEQACWMGAGNRWPCETHMKVRVKLRHGPTLLDATLKKVGVGKGEVTLDQHEQKGIAVGQFCALYNVHDDACLGSGVICEVAKQDAFNSESIDGRDASPMQLF